MEQKVNRHPSNNALNVLSSCFFFLTFTFQLPLRGENQLPCSLLWKSHTHVPSPTKPLSPLFIYSDSTYLNCMILHYKML